ncbi:MAG: class I adenylate-forming enzyme family protein [Halodesulfurarchaeum sp.]
MVDWFAHRARSDPDTLALGSTRTGKTWTYGELDEEIGAVARSLIEEGVDSDSRVAVLLSRSASFVRMVWAVMRIGATLAPLNVEERPDAVARKLETLDPDLVVASDAANAVSESGDALQVRGSAETGQTTRWLVRSLSTLERPVSEQSSGGSESETGSAGISPPVEGTPVPADSRGTGLDETAVILFTSGTTGTPKAVRLTARNLGASAAGSAFRLGVRPDDRWLLTLPMYHMGGLAIPFRAAMYGIGVVLQSDFEPQETIKAVDEWGVTGVSLVPTMLDRLLSAGWEPDALRFALVGGARTPPELAHRALAAGVPIYPTYGMTETASQVATATPNEVAANPETVGRPLRTARVRLLPVDNRPETGAIAEGSGRKGDDSGTGDTRDIGEIAVGGPIVSPGYLEAGRSLAEEGWFRTGDIGRRLESGQLVVTGRLADRITTGGETVDPTEIEQVIESLRGVDVAVVVGVPDPEWGERVVAAVVGTEEREGTTLREELRERLAGYKVPKEIKLLQTLPRTPSGTVDREAVREHFT